MRLVAPAGTATSPVVSPAQESAPAAAAAVGSPPAAVPAGQRVVQKMVTQVVDLAGLTKPQLVGWQQKINEGKAKLALVNGRRVRLRDGEELSELTAAAVGWRSPAQVSGLPGRSCREH